jgi:hypothetical protein
MPYGHATGNGQGEHLLPQPLQQSLALIRVVMIAQKPPEPPPQPHPVGQQALRQQRLQLFNPGISHTGTQSLLL